MLSMDQNAEELHRLWEEIRQGTTTSCSSLTTEKQSDSHSNLSTPSLISNLDIPSPLSAFSVEIEDIFNFDLDEVLPPSPTAIEHNQPEAGFRPISITGDSSEDCEISTTEDTTRVSSTTSEAGLNRKEELDSPPILGRKEAEYSPQSGTAQSHPGEISQDYRKRPLSPSVTYNGPDQKARKIERPRTPQPTKREKPIQRNTHRHYRPPPLLKLMVKPTPALAERLATSGYLPLKKGKYPRKSR